MPVQRFLAQGETQNANTCKGKTYAGIYMCSEKHGIAVCDGHQAHKAKQGP